MNEIETVFTNPPEEPSKSGLVAFGILQIIIGAICLLAVAGMIAAVKFSHMNPDAPTAKMGLRAVLPGLLMYLGAGIWLLWMGIGSIKARRWARALIVVSSWIWMVTGISGLIWMTFFMNNMAGETMGGQEITPQMASMMRYGSMSFMFFATVLIPGVLLLYYSRNKVRQTVMHYDSVTCWTDKAPLPVLVLCGLCLMGVVSIINLGNTGWVVPFFGKVLSGAPGAVTAVVSAVLTGYATWLIYRLKPAGWKLVLVLTVFWVISMVITFSQVSINEFYSRMDFTAFQPERPAWMEKSISAHETAIKLYFCATTVVFLGFLFYMKRFFKGPESPRMS